MSSNNHPVFSHKTQRNSDDLPGTTSSGKKGPVLCFQNLSYESQEKSGFPFCWKTTDKRTLSVINGIMKPGLNAIMGPPGGGKSLLLGLLAARKKPRGLSGNVWVHGVPKCNSGYVVQDDVVMSTLSMRENMQFSASLRLPTTMSKEEKNNRISKVIEKLGLHEMADSKVKSKGERKMVSIGMELILDPSILFLDEPTTGLDWNTAYKIIKLLKSISEQERTIIFSIHQPGYSIFNIFDSLTLLASGKLMYHGPAQEALEYFKSAGYKSECYIIPEEFFLDIITGIIKRESEDHEASNTEMPLENEESVIESLAEFYTKSPICGETKSELERLSKDLNKRRLFREEITYVTSFGHQLIHITRRSFQNLVGHPRPWIVQLIGTLILGLVVGVTFLLLRDHCTEIQIRAGVLFFLMVYQCLSSVSVMEFFVNQNQLFLHEHISGYYKVSSYFFGNILFDLLSRRFLPSFIFTCILYLMMGLKPEVEAFFIMSFTLMMVAFSSISLALAIGAGNSDTTTATCIADIYFIFMMIFLGLSLYFENMTPQLSWIHYFSIPYYGLTALLHNEFLGQYFCSALSTTPGRICSNYVMCSGDEFLMIQDIDLSPWGLWKNHVALASLMIIFLTIAYLKFLFLKTPILSSASIFYELDPHLKRTLI
ncbi:broad substrate specificity ATP-binding cassette transporter ABCG2-like [Marmota flaviventris]|uniref:broad substrate specificity ATP-binding cassette transporter ABCG2-like n=1 Tax=Marmota flaviventris TaxID=93162 RepID=UPI003A8A07FF